MYKNIRKKSREWMEYPKTTTTPSKQSVAVSSQAGGEPNATRHSLCTLSNAKTAATTSSSSSTPQVGPNKASAPSISVNKMPVSCNKMTNTSNKMSMTSSSTSKTYPGGPNKVYNGVSSKVFKASNRLPAGVNKPQPQPQQKSMGSSKTRMDANKMSMGVKDVQPEPSKKPEVSAAPPKNKTETAKTQQKPAANKVPEKTKDCSTQVERINKTTENRAKETTVENAVALPCVTSFIPEKISKMTNDKLSQKLQIQEQTQTVFVDGNTAVPLPDSIYVDRLTIAEKIAMIPEKIAKIPDKMAMMATNMMMLAEQMADRMPRFPLPLAAFRMPFKLPMYPPVMPAWNLPFTPTGEYNDEADLVIDPINIKHYLKSAWTFWYLEHDQSKTWEEMQTEISTITTVEDFWFLYSHFKTPSQLNTGCDYSFFKKGIRPMWEDAANRNGGRWVITFFKKCSRDLDCVWLDVMLCLIGDTLRNTNEICGAVVNIRGKNNKISVWTANKTNETAILDVGMRLRKALRLGIQNLKYQFHQDLMKVSKVGVQSIYIL